MKKTRTKHSPEFKARIELGWVWEYRNCCVIQGCCDKSPIWAPLRQSNLSLSQSYTPSRPDGSWRYMLQHRTA